MQESVVPEEGRGAGLCVGEHTRVSVFRALFSQSKCSASVGLGERSVPDQLYS